MEGVEELSDTSKIAVYSGTRNYYQHMLPAFTSLIVNSSVDKIVLFIEDDEFPYPLPSIVRTVNISCNHLRFFDFNGLNYKTKWTYMALYKMALPFIFQSSSNLLYLDVDTIVDKNIDDIWDIKLGDYYFGAVKEQHKSNENSSYYNTGVLLINCKKLLSDNMCKSIIDALNHKQYQFPEQDCMNELCKDRILEIPSDYNVTWFNAPPNEEKIIHYATVDNWSNMPLYQKYVNEYKEMLKIK